MSLVMKQAPIWRKIQKNNFTKADSLAEFLELDEEKRQQLVSKKHFPMNIPRRLAEKMEKNTLSDPLFMQFVELKESNSVNAPENFIKDPVKDSFFQKTPYILHKYHGRVLFMPTGACAMHCRYCFRQNFDYTPSSQGFEKEKEYLKLHPSIQEVILSGGDPLSLSNSKLEEIFTLLEEIEHVKIIRFHTRFPIGIPERIDDGLLSILKKSSKQIIFIIHSNHPKELDAEVCDSLKKIQQLAIPVMCQSVLLKGVNNSTMTLKELFLKLVKNGIIPYYLHMLDYVEGSEAFHEEESEAIKIMDKLREILPGYALPRLVREVPFKTNKTPVN
ncbi:MAG: KamA family radical SAM protein [Chlamydiales bacterium]|nr:KamA family radical SAM protein [Chlamydiales bacterium]